MTKRFETETYTAPACWASYLINGDASGLDYYNTPDDPAGDREIAAADAFIESVGLGSPVSCSEESEFRWHPDYCARSADGRKLGGDCLTYSFLRQVEESAPTEVES
jgi:hypothetical protein